MNKKINKKILVLILIAVVILGITFIYVFINKNNKNVLKTYLVNEYGLMRDEDSISDELFDEYGNLTHYKYKQKLENGSIIEKEYNIKYTFDDKKRISKVEYENNHIKIEYNNENKISKLVNLTKNEDLENKYEFNFSYDNNEIKVTSKKLHTDSNKDINYTINEEYTLTETIIDNEEYSICTISEDNLEKQKYIYKMKNKDVNYSNVFSLLNINFEGYVSFLNDIRNNFTIELPIFNSGNIVSLEDLVNNTNTNTNFSYNNYYDKNNNILKCDRVLNSDIYYMYEKISNKEYYGYCLEINNGNYKYIKYKDYLNESEIYKREILEEKLLSEDESKDKLTKFQQYFEANK